MLVITFLLLQTQTCSRMVIFYLESVNSIISSSKINGGSMISFDDVLPFHLTLLYNVTHPFLVLIL